jgi:hypothetical protein
MASGQRQPEQRPRRPGHHPDPFHVEVPAQLSEVIGDRRRGGPRVDVAVPEARPVDEHLAHAGHRRVGGRRQSAVGRAVHDEHHRGRRVTGNGAFTGVVFVPGRGPDQLVGEPPTVGQVEALHPVDIGAGRDRRSAFGHRTTLPGQLRWPE